jgi:predicted RNA binding protein YcfA (HicA-like mRNA interferase family)
MSPALPIVCGSGAIKALQLNGFEKVSQRGSHVKLRHKDRRSVIIPEHYELAKGTLRSILRQADVDVEEFIKLIRA